MSTSGAAKNIQRLEMRVKRMLNPEVASDGELTFFDKDPQCSIVFTDDNGDHLAVIIPKPDDEAINAKYDMMCSLGASFDAKQDYLWSIVDKYRRIE